MEKIWLKHYPPGVPKTIKYPKVPLHHLLEDSASRFPRNTAIIFPGAFDDERRVTYRELDEKSNRLANAPSSSIRRTASMATRRESTPGALLALEGPGVMGGRAGPRQPNAPSLAGSRAAFLTPERPRGARLSGQRVRLPAMADAQFGCPLSQGARPPGPAYTRPETEHP